MPCCVQIGSCATQGLHTHASCAAATAPLRMCGVVWARVHDPVSAREFVFDGMQATVDGHWCLGQGVCKAPGTDPLFLQVLLRRHNLLLLTYGLFERATLMHPSPPAPSLCWKGKG